MDVGNGLLLRVDPRLPDGPGLGDLGGKLRSERFGQRHDVGVAVAIAGVAREHVADVADQTLCPVRRGAADLDVTAAVPRVATHAVHDRPVLCVRELVAAEQRVGTGSEPRLGVRIVRRQLRRVVERRERVVLVEVPVQTDHVEQRGSGLERSERGRQGSVGPRFVDQPNDRGVSAGRQIFCIQLGTVGEELVSGFERPVLGRGRIEASLIGDEVVQRLDDLGRCLDQATDRPFRQEQFVVAHADPGSGAVGVIGAVHPGEEGRDAFVVADEVLGERPLVGEVRVVDDVGHRDLAIVADDDDVADPGAGGGVAVDDLADGAHDVVRPEGIAGVGESSPVGVLDGVSPLEHALDRDDRPADAEGPGVSDAGSSIQDALRLGRIGGPQELLVHQEQRVDVRAQRRGCGHVTCHPGRVRGPRRAIPLGRTVGAEAERVRLVGERRVVRRDLDEVRTGAQGPRLDLLVVDAAVRRDRHRHVIGRIETEPHREGLGHVLHRVGLHRIIERIQVGLHVVDIADRRRGLVAQRCDRAPVQHEVVVGRKVAQEQIPTDPEIGVGLGDVEAVEVDRAGAADVAEVDVDARARGVAGDRERANGRERILGVFDDSHVRRGRAHVALAAGRSDHARIGGGDTERQTGSNADCHRTQPGLQVRQRVGEDRPAGARAAPVGFQGQREHGIAQRLPVEGRAPRNIDEALREHDLQRRRRRGRRQRDVGLILERIDER